MVEAIESKSVMVSSAKRYGRTDKGKPLRGLVIELLGRGFFQGSIYAFNLAVGPGMFGKA